MPSPRSRSNYQVTYDYVAERIVGLHHPRLPYESRFIKQLCTSALEAGLSHTDAVRLSVGIFKEVDLIARDENNNLLSPSALRDVRNFARAILRSGSTFSSFEIAVRAVATWRLQIEERQKLHAEWDRQTIKQRLKMRKIRQEAAAKIRQPPPPAQVQGHKPEPEPEPVEPELGHGEEFDNGLDGLDYLYTTSGFEDLQRLDLEVYRDLRSVSED